VQLQTIPYCLIQSVSMLIAVNIM